MVDRHGPDPTVHRRRLRNELRDAREAAQKTQKTVAEAMDWSLSKLIRIEAGTVAISTNDLRALLTHYDVERARIDQLVDLARSAREPTRWSSYRDIAEPEFIAYLGYEASASIIRNFEPLLVPGLLQTEEYAHEALSSIFPGDAKGVARRLALRMERQELLARAEPPSMHFIMDEAAIRRVVGGRDAMRRQLRHLTEIAERPNITIRIVPFEHGMYPRIRLSYVLFEFPDTNDPDILYIEQPLGELVIREDSPEEEKQERPIAHLEYFWDIEQIAHSENTPGLLQDAISRLSTAT
jgi:transcriptional regulator with XRE-family HTH domain